MIQKIAVNLKIITVVTYPSRSFRLLMSMLRCSIAHSLSIYPTEQPE